MGTYGTNTFRVTFANKTLAEIFILDLQTINNSGNAMPFDYELRSPTQVFIYAKEQEQVCYMKDRPSKTLENFIGTRLHLSANLLDNKSTKFEAYIESQDWFWDNVSSEKLVAWAGLDDSNVPDDCDLDEMLNDWAYDSEYIYEDDIITYEDVWENGVRNHKEPEITDELFREMAKSFREYFEENK